MIHSVIASYSSIGTAGRAIAASRLRRIRALLDPRAQRALRNESGSSLVEFALTSVILFTLLFGVIAICTALYTYNVVAEVAREATRYAIVRGSKCNSFSDCPNITSTQLQTYVSSLQFPGINSLTATPSWPAGNENPGNPVQVTVTYSFPLSIPFIPRRTLSMSSTSQMVISQ